MLNSGFNNVSLTTGWHKIKTVQKALYPLNTDHLPILKNHMSYPFQIPLPIISHEKLLFPYAVISHYTAIIFYHTVWFVVNIQYQGIGSDTRSSLHVFELSYKKTLTILSNLSVSRPQRCHFGTILPLNRMRRQLSFLHLTSWFKW